MEHFVTLFDSLFLPQGLALHLSMERHIKDYTLWIVCMDEDAHAALAKLDLPNVRLLELGKVETPELLRVKPKRTISEYCWTVTPFAPRIVFEADPDISRVTYVDADLWFRKHPAAIFRELEASGKNVLITDHAFAPEYDHSTTLGQYCVQFITFTRGGGETVRKWWEERCIEWCYARAEDGKFGDQKYLDDWPERFPDAVHVLNDKELALGPWNATRFPYGRSIFYHFHGLRLTSETSLNVSAYAYILKRPLIEYVYRPYIADLREASAILKRAGVKFRQQAESAGLLSSALRRLGRIYQLVVTTLPSGKMRW